MSWLCVLCTDNHIAWLCVICTDNHLTSWLCVICTDNHITWLCTENPITSGLCAICTDNHITSWLCAICTDNPITLCLCRVTWRSWRVCQWPPSWTGTRSPSRPHRSASSNLFSCLSLSPSVSSFRRLRFVCGAPSLVVIDERVKFVYCVAFCKLP